MLINIPRHSGRSRGEVARQLFHDKVVREIRDFGRGIPPVRLKNFQAVGTNFGVGLAGMRERLRELGGQLEIRSEHGTIVSVTMPLRESAKAVDASAAD